MSRVMNKVKKRVGLTLSFIISIVLINLIATIIVGALMYILFDIGILNKENINDVMVLPILTLIALTIIGAVVSAFSSKLILKNIREFIEGTEKLSRGDFSVRINIKHPSEFKILSENFNLMAKELGGIEVLRTDFINNFSHEFKTPIISIKGFAEILKDDNLPRDERNEYLDIIIEESKRLTTLSNNVLNLSKIENVAILKDTKVFNIGEQLRQAILILHSKFENKNILLDINIGDYNINGSKEMLNQVWINLLDNAVKFNRENGIISIALKKKEDNIIITISDNGIGISKEALPKVFDKFYQGDTSHSTLGNGLGLAMVKKIIELHNGTIKCDSLHLRGTRFTITLPINC